MPARAVVTLSFPTAARAAVVGRALASDNPGAFTRQSVEGPVVTLTAEGPNVRSLRETLDDYLRCAGAADQAAARGGRPAKRL